MVLRYLGDSIMNRQNPIATQKRRFKNGVTAALEICADRRAQECGVDVAANGSGGKREAIDRTAAMVEAAAAKLKASDFSELEAVCASQVLALDVIFTEYAKGCSESVWTYGPMIVALKAQQQCRATIRALLSLTANKKSRNFDEQTIENAIPPA